jgi:hypothetical protein
MRKKYMMRWLERRSERDPFSCVCSSSLLSLALSRSLSNTNAAEEVEDTRLSCIEIGMYIIQ